MNETDLVAIEGRLDALMVPLLVPLRATKELDGTAMAELLSLGDGLIEAVSTRHDVPRTLVAKTWFVFTQMLNEADHAREPEPILDAAWAWAELLRRAYGPTF